MSITETTPNHDSATATATEPAVGICCSGGGIRAAAFALGCLQVLDEKDVLRGPERARYISAVSGGSYAVGAMALIQLSIEGAPADAPVDRNLGPFEHGSPELHRLRTRLSYLTDGGLRSELWRALMGVVMNIALLTALTAVVGYTAGWIYGWRVPQIRSTCRGGAAAAACSTSIHTPAGLAGTGVVIAILAVVVGLVWVGHRWSPQVAPLWQNAAVGLAVAALAWAVVVLALPQLLAWLHRASVGHLSHNASAASTGLRQNWISAGGLAGVAVALAGVFGPMWRVLRPVADRDAVKKSGRSFIGSHRRLLLNLLAAIAVPVLFLSLLIMFMLHGGERPLFVSGTGGLEILYVLVPLVFLAAVAGLGDLNSWSLHSLYRARLASAFNLERSLHHKKHAPKGELPDLVAKPRTDPVPLSSLGPKNFPEVLICATSNIRNYGLVPTGAGALPFLFSQDIVGGPVVGELNTSVYEAAGLRGPRSITVMDAVSISGAAVAPEMGKMTRAPLRLLLALSNIRLGVWIPKPDVVRRKAARKEAKLVGALAGGGLKQSRRGVVKPPGLMYLVHEAIGAPPKKAHHVYVSDGGHYDNLGLVALLERRCEWIWCVDASGDHIDKFSTLGGALAIAEAEWNITVDIDPRIMAPEPPTSRFVQQTYCRGTITYPPEVAGMAPTQGVLIVVKAGVPDKAPWAIGAYHQEHEAFPCDSTINQLYAADRFDAYLALGRFSMRAAYKNTAAEYDEIATRIRKARRT